MRKTLNKEYRCDFADAFHKLWRSPGLRKVKKDKVYGKPFFLEEFRYSWRVSANGITERFVSLYDVATFLFDELFDPKEVYIRFKPRHKKVLAKLLSCLKAMVEQDNSILNHNKDSYEQIKNAIL